MSEASDVVVVGAGAAGLMAAIAAGRSLGGGVVAVDGAARLGAKILIAGGGRCNVAHAWVDERAYAGSSALAIRNVLGRFGIAETVSFFRELGVELKEEKTGKLFPTTDDARTVLQALLTAAGRAGVKLRHPWRVRAVRVAEGGFEVVGDGGLMQARRVILATGGKSLPKTGSDGAGLEMARALGHSVTRLAPALAPLTLERGCFLCELSGVSTAARLELRAAGGERVKSFTNSVLFTHFGLSGPGPMDLSRYVEMAWAEGMAHEIVLDLLAGFAAEEFDKLLREGGRSSVLSVLRRARAGARVEDVDDLAEGAEVRAELPERLARAVAERAGVDAGGACHGLTREARRGLVEAFKGLRLPVTGSRGYAYAEATAGGVPLSEVKLGTMESRVRPGLHLCGEMLDVDGRIGGFNFQWAWASGHVAGRGAAAGLANVQAARR